MSVSRSTLEILVQLRDEASRKMTGVSGKFNGLGRAAKRAATAMTAVGGALAGVAALGVRTAADAEGAWNKFNTVFGEHSDDMTDFVKDLRKEMPTAQHEIIRMAADLQDLLVPLGLARDQATGLSQGFLDVANKIAAFNDVAPTEVLEAVKSALAGSSEPLRRFGVNALESSLEARALSEGLLEVGQTFKDLEPEVKNQIRAQALLAQVIDNSSDAINGFEENNDSFIRRTQELQATWQEFRAEIGTRFLPVADALLKALLPFIRDVLPKFFDGIARIGERLAFVKDIFGELPGLLGRSRDRFMEFVELVQPMTDVAKSALQDLWAVLKFNLWPALQDLWAAIKPMATFVGVTLYGAFIGLVYALTSAVTILTTLIEIATFFANVGRTVLKPVVDVITSAFTGLMNGIQGVIDGLKSVIEFASRAYSKVKKTLSFGGDSESVDDAIIAPNGRIITTNPRDYLIATQNPHALVGSGGGGINISIGNLYGTDRDAAERFSHEIVRKIKQQIRI